MIILVRVSIMSSSLLQMNTIFISILIEALPFILLGVIISGIIHCIADSGVFGMLVQFPDDVSFKNDDWVTRVK